MKTFLLILFLAIAFFAGCEENENSNNTSMIFIESFRGGCADGLPPATSILGERSDTVYYYIEDNTLIIFVGFETTCCIFYEADAIFEDGIIKMYLDEIWNDPCDCICWYEFNFKFRDFERKSYPYEVIIDGDLKFNGIINFDT